MRFKARVPATEYIMAVNLAPVSLSEPNESWRPMTALLSARSAALCRYRHNAAERALRGIALGRKSWLFAGSDRGGERAAVIYTLIGTAKLNVVDPQAWLADVLGRIAEQPQTRLHELLPWHCKADREQALAA